MTSPTLVSVTATSATTITLHFDSAVSAGDGNIVISDGHSQSYVGLGGLTTRIIGANDTRTIDDDSSALTYSGQDIVIHLDSALADGVTYSITMDAGTVLANGSSDANARIGSTTLYTFTASGTASEVATPGAAVDSTIHFTDTGVSDTDYITSAQEQTVTGTYTGTLSSGDFIQVSLDNGASWYKATVDGNTWSYSGEINTGNLVSNASGDLDGTLLARVSNTAGGSSSTVSQDYVYSDGTPTSNAPSLSGRALSLASGSDSGASSSDGITNSASAVTLNVAGLHGLHAGDTIEIVDTSNNSVVVGSYVIETGDLYYGTSDYLSVDYTNADERSTIDIALSTTLSDGNHTLAARIVDAAGEVGDASSTTLVTADTTAPVISTTSPVEGTVGVNFFLDTLTFTFNEDIVIADGTQLTIASTTYPDNTQVVTLSSSDISGRTLTVHLDTPLNPENSYTVQGAIISDVAGNVGITGDTPMLHFTTGDAMIITPTPGPPTLSLVDTAPASDTDSASALHTDGITSNNFISVSYTPGADWYYRLSSSGDWILGSGDGFTLPDGVYGMDDIQVKQVFGNVESDVSTINQTLTIDTNAPTAYATGIRNAFSAGADSINGSLLGSTSLDNEVVEITFDHGATWVKATTTYVNSNVSWWSLSGIASQLGDNYGVRLVDLAGNVSSYATLGNSNPQYFLANGGVTFNYASANDIVVFGGTGHDVITVGNHSVVHSGDTGDTGDTVVTGDDAEITVGNASTVTTGAGSTVTTGNGDNTVHAGTDASVTTGTGNDNITLSTLSGSSVHAGTGTDLLIVNDTSTVSLSELSAYSGIEVLYFASGGNNDITIGSSDSVKGFSDNGYLVINAAGNNSTVHLDGSVWVLTATASDYYTYRDGLGSGSNTLVIGVGLTVDIPTGPTLSFVDTAPVSAASNSALHSDGITSDNFINVGNTDGNTWYYRIGGGDWQLGSGDGFTLEDGVYDAGTIQVKQTVGDLSSSITTLQQELTVDTNAPTIYATGTANAFSAASNSISGAVQDDGSGASVVEVTFDHGTTWVAASSDDGLWQLSGISSQLKDNYGVRLVDLAGNISSHGTDYYLANGGATFNYYSEDNLVVYGGGGHNVITVGNFATVYGGNGQNDIITGNVATIYGGSGHNDITAGNYATVYGGDGDTVVAGQESTVNVGDSSNVTVGLYSSVTTGNGDNSVTAGYGSTVKTGSGNDVISFIAGVTVDGGAGADTVNLDVDGGGHYFYLSALSVTNVETLILGSGNSMYISSASTVANFSGGSQLTIDSGSANNVTLDSSVWGYAGDSGGYRMYSDDQGHGNVVLLIGSQISVYLQSSA
ncbi:hypothetical protein GJ699_28895 [Duganella sp. FT80W]|uniref:SbsA Ig-like domain-containing protein n=1 Tax=Duganella guangzhouensis TaxID=2666084 RepID=A0A6I2L6Y9_9BURK|nr:Ig-like domain-containing protein [Duganella guangzhouensis]MRW94015.1 hypothetical protein [Duganella guangzhouensis]